MSTLTLRPARREEIPAVVALNLAAFGPSAGMPQAFFPDPERRAIDYPAWRLLNATAEFDDSGRHTIVVTDRAEDGTEKIVATAEWIAPGGADPVTPLEERKAKWREIQKEWPTSLDRAATIEFGNAVGPSMAAALEAAGLPEGADNNMWDLNSIAVADTHRRRGIAQMLVQWGIDRAKEDGKDVFLIANPAGTPLYQKMGFKQIGETVTFAGKPYQQCERFFLLRQPL